jgi:hypothetical protein
MSALMDGWMGVCAIAISRLPTAYDDDDDYDNNSNDDDDDDDV